METLRALGTLAPGGGGGFSEAMDELLLATTPSFILDKVQLYPAAGQCHPAAGQCHPAVGPCHPAVGQVLQSWESRFDRIRNGLTRDALCLLLASRHGLSEPELAELLDVRSSPSAPVPPRREHDRVEYAGCC